MKKVFSKILGGLISAVLILQFNVIVYADEITDLQNEQASNEEKMQDAQEQKDQVTQAKSEALQQVEEIENQIADYETQINALDTKIADLNNQITEAEEQINQKQADYDEQQELLEKRLVVTYESGETSFLDVLLSSKSLTDLISNYYMISEIAQADMNLMESIENEKNEIEQAKTTLEQSKQELDTSRSEKESMSVQLESARQEKATYVSQLSTEEQELQAQIDELEEANKSIDAEIQQKQAEIQKKLQQQRPSSAGSSSGSSSSGSNSSSGSSSGSSSNGGTSTGGGAVSSSGFIYPVPSGYTRITTRMYYSSGQYHGAVDFGSSGINGQPVYAVADGVVVTAKALNYSYGNYIIIAHYNGLYTLYAHGQSGSIRVSEGDYVSQGQQIMNVGSTGNSTGPHLHFEVRTSPGLYANRVDPTNYLP